MQHPLVSICIPTYNGAAFLQQALDSVSAQTYRPLEVIISDDRSADATLDIAENFKAVSGLPVQIYLHEPSGIGANWNHSVKQATGHYIKFLFQDDVLEPDCVSEMVNTLESEPELAVVACKRTFIPEGTPTIEQERWIRKYGDLQQQLEVSGNSIRLDKALFGRADFLKSPLNKIGEPSAIMIRRTVFDTVGYFDEDLEQILDYVFLYRVLKQYPIHILNKSLIRFRIHEAQATHVNRNRDIPDYKEYRKILYREFYPLLHPANKKKLALKFSFRSKLKNSIKRVFKRITS